MRKRIGLLVLIAVTVLGILCWWSFSSKQESTLSTSESYYVDTGINWSLASQDAREYRVSFERLSAAVASGAKCYDIRPFIDYQLGHLEIAEQYPLSEMRLGKFPQLVTDIPIYVYGADRSSSAEAASRLRREGFQYVYDLGDLKQVEAIGGKLGSLW